MVYDDEDILDDEEDDEIIMQPDNDWGKIFAIVKTKWVL